MTTQKRRVHLLGEDDLHQQFATRLLAAFDVGERQISSTFAPQAKGSAAQFVIDNFERVYKAWHSKRRDAHVYLLVLIDGDEKGVHERRRTLKAILAPSDWDDLVASNRFALLTPTWHLETWVAFLCGERPIDEKTRYKKDGPGKAVWRKIEDREYTAAKAVKNWTRPDPNEGAMVPSLVAGRAALTTIGFK